MWIERIDDRLKAEGIEDQDFNLLFVDRGTIIVATRDFKQLDFAQILEGHGLTREGREIVPGSTIGGWGRFARETCGKHVSAGRKSCPHPKRVSGALKKGGRGWLHAQL
jgi:hypothetical protein